MNQEQQIIENQGKIAELIQSIQLWQNTPIAAEVRAKIAEDQERTMFRIRQLEIEGQEAKIAHLTRTLAAFKGEPVHA